MASGSSVFAVAVLASVFVMGIRNMEKSNQGGDMVEYESQGWFRECGIWDADNRRFLVSYVEGGLGQVAGNGREETVVKDPDYAGNATLGFVIDSPRNRIVVAIADFLGNKYSAVAAYDMNTWQRHFFTQLNNPEDGKSWAHDVAVDVEGNAYVTDSKGNRIWKVSPEGAVVAVIESMKFTSVTARLPFNVVGLNGVVYHPGGFLLAVHTWAGVLFKVSLDGSDVRAVNMSSVLLLGQGLTLLSPERLVVVGTPSARIVESRDGWLSAGLTHRYVGPLHRVATCASVRDGRVFVSHLVGLGFPTRKHLISEAIFGEVSLPN